MTSRNHVNPSPRVSVVLPTFDRARLLPRAIESVLAQTFHDFELLVVDDGSTDDTPSVVESYAGDRLSYVRLERNTGAAAARNVGIRRAAGDLVAFQDSDDEWLPEKLERQVRAFDEGAETPRIDVVYCDMLRVHADGTSSYHASPEIVPGRLVNPDTRFYQVWMLGIQACVIRRECFDVVGLFDESMPSFEDLELFIRLSRAARFVHVDEPLVRYHETEGLSKNRAANRASRRRLLELYEADLATDDPDFLAGERAFLLAEAAKGR
jgi:glycosyltransferase involved in cell wall biosynthesis